MKNNYLHDYCFELKKQFPQRYPLINIPRLRYINLLSHEGGGGRGYTWSYYYIAKLPPYFSASLKYLSAATSLCYEQVNKS